jgi:transcriptional regulator GlxA family with amidase domain
VSSVSLVDEIVAVDDSPCAVIPDIRVGFVLCPRFSLLPFAGFVDFLRHAADEADHSRQIYCTWKTISSTPDMVPASCGLFVKPDTVFPDPESFDYIVIVGGLLPQCLDVGEATLDYLRRAYASNVSLVGLCTGSFVLASAGLLRGRRCAVHMHHRADFERRFPDTFVLSDQLYVSDNNITTSPGGVPALDLALAIIEMHCGRSKSEKGSQTLMMAPRAVNDERINQPYARLSSCGNKVVEQAIRLMETEVARPCSIKALARKLHHTEREMTRAFVKVTDESPASIWRAIRLDRSRRLLLNTTKTLTQIAYDCGFADNAHFSRWFKRTYGESPTLYRKHRSEPLALSH